MRWFRIEFSKNDEILIIVLLTRTSKKSPRKAMLFLLNKRRSLWEKLMLYHILKAKLAKLFRYNIENITRSDFGVIIVSTL